jgi:hypothetical protein
VTNVFNIFRNSIGDIANPAMKEWKEGLKDHHNTADFYIGLVWFFMIVN